MASVLALISKAVFEELPGRAFGSVVPLDRYTSKNAIFSRLTAEDSLFLVTVRDGDVLLLVARIDAPKRKGESVVGTVNTTPIQEISVKDFELEDGNGIKAKRGRLGMSLQTPRALAEADVTRLRALGGAATAAPAAAVKMKLQPKAKKASKDAAIPEVKLKGGKVSARAQAIIAQIYKAPDDRGLRTVLADQLLEDQHVWGELISLQLSDPKKHRERIEKLVNQHARDIVGEIANVASREDMEIVDGFLVRARCGKSKSFTSAAQRQAAAVAPQWATVREVELTFEMPGTFQAALLANPATTNLLTVKFDSYRPFVALKRPKSGDPWEIASPRANYQLEALSDTELARITPPKVKSIVTMLDEERAKRAKRAAKSPKPKKQPAAKKRRR